MGRGGQRSVGGGSPHSGAVAGDLASSPADIDVVPATPTTPTFLFTDIEGSTRLVRETGPSYVGLLEVHRRLLRQAFGAQQGSEVGTHGDSFFVVFPTPSQAVAAAVAAQRALAQHPWPDGEAIRVRMGIHTGEATMVGGDYVGLEVHRAARIGATGHGGQVVLSAATSVLLRDALPDGVSLRSLGRYRLKDFTHPEEIFQVDIAGIPSEFPPLKALTGPGDLPVTMTDLIGRDREVQAVIRLLREGRRLVTLTGPGGIGKTRLALEVARGAEPDFTAGVVFVPLASLADADLVLVTVADRLGVRGEHEIPLVQAIAGSLGGKGRTLLVLDNFEQVVGAGPDVLALLDQGPAISCLVTSRQVLRVRGEQEYRVPQLSEDEAVRLFEVRAAAVRPGFTVTEESIGAVTEIAHRLDGLPLAIELAAARTRLFAPEALLDRLVHSVDVLARGAVDAPERQRTLRATMEWSYALLDDHEKAVLARLAVFVGGWTIDAAEAVCGRGGEPDVVDTLAGLLDKSLLVAPDCTSCEPRLHLLETVRAYALEKLAERPERDEVERRHLDWVLALAAHVPGVMGPDHQLWVERFDQERANLRAAVRRALQWGDLARVARLVRDTFGYLSQRDAEIEAVGWLDEALRHGDAADPAVRARLLVIRALAATVFADFTGARAHLAEAVPLLPDSPDLALDRVFAVAAEAYCAMGEWPPERAAPIVEQAGARAAAVGADLAHAYMETARGSLALHVGELDVAEGHYRTAVEVGRRMGNGAIVGRALSLLGLTELAGGDPACARDHIVEGARANLQGGQRTSMAYSAEGLAAAALAQGQARVAAQALAAATSAREQFGHPALRAFVPVHRDLAARARGELGDDAYEAAVSEGRASDITEVLDRTLHLLGSGSPQPTTT